MKRRPQLASALMPGLPARYPTSCKRCDKAIAVGDRIAHLRGDYICVDCASGQGDE